MESIFIHHQSLCTETPWHLSTYSGLKVTRSGRWDSWSLFISFAVTLVDSKLNDFNFFRLVKCFNPALVILELETFKDTKFVNSAFQKFKVQSSYLIKKTKLIISYDKIPDIISRDLSDRWLF